jgi:hypothetical protein
MDATMENGKWKMDVTMENGCDNGKWKMDVKMENGKWNSSFQFSILNFQFSITYKLYSPRVHTVCP